MQMGLGWRFLHTPLVSLPFLVTDVRHIALGVGKRYGSFPFLRNQHWFCARMMPLPRQKQSPVGSRLQGIFHKEIGVACTYVDPGNFRSQKSKEILLHIETLSKFSTYSIYRTSFGTVFLLCISYIVNKPATTTITIAVK